MELERLYITLAVEAAEMARGFTEATRDGLSWGQQFGKQVSGAIATAFLAGVAVVLTALAGIGIAAFNLSSDIQAASGDLQASLGVTAEEADKLADIAADAWGNNFAGSIEEAAAAVGIVRQQLGNLSDNELQRATENAFRLKDAFGTDVNQSVDAAATLMEHFGLSSDEAFDLIANGFQSGLNRSGDFLETVTEYSNQFAGAGAGADEFFGFLQSGLQGGVLGTDKAADAFKEFTLRIQDGSDLTSESLEAIGINADEFIESINSGEITVADAFGTVIGAMNDTEDAQAQLASGVGLLGTQFEDLGFDTARSLELIPDAFEHVEGSAASLDAQYNTLGDAVEGFKRRFILSFKPIGDTLLGLATSTMPLVEQGFAFFETNIIPMIEAAALGIQTFVDAISGGAEPIEAIGLALTAAGFSEEFIATVTNVATSVSDFFNSFVEFMEPIVNAAAEFVTLNDILIVLGLALAAVVVPALLSVVAAMAPIIIGIGLAIAVVALLRTAWEENWGGIQEKTQAVIDFIVPLVTGAVESIKTWWSENGDAILLKASEIWEGVKEAINTALTFIRDEIIVPIGTAIAEFWAEHGDTIKEKAELAWELIKAAIDTALKNIELIFEAFKLAFEGDWEGFGVKLREAWDNAWELIKLAFDTFGRDILLKISTTITDIIAKFGETDWGQVGKDIMAGIASGITSAISSIQEAARSASQAAIDAATGFLGIESPSKVAAKLIGAPYSEGVAIGIESMAGMVESAAVDLFGFVDEQSVSGVPATTPANVQTSSKTINRQQSYVYNNYGSTPQDPANFFRQREAAANLGG